MIATYDDAIAQAERLWDQSNGGFGAMLLFDHDWAPWRAEQEHDHLSPTT